MMKLCLRLPQCRDEALALIVTDVAGALRRAEVAGPAKRIQRDRRRQPLWPLKEQRHAFVPVSEVGIELRLGECGLDAVPLPESVGGESGDTMHAACAGQ